MHHLQRGTQDSTTKVAVRVPEASGEAAEPGGPVSTLGDCHHFVLIVGVDLIQFALDKF